jgi:hypothetical protein
MNLTAVLHLVATLLIGAGLLISGQELTLGLFGIGGALIIAGIAVARRDDTGEDGHPGQQG